MMRERAAKDDKREEPNEGWGGAVPGGTATRTGERPTRATCVGVILVVQQKGVRSRRSHVERDRHGWCNVERTPDWPCFLVGPRVDCPHRQPRKNTRLHRMVVKDFIAHGISRIPWDATSRGMRRGLSGTAHLERNRRAGAGTSRRVCAALVRRTTWALRRVGSAAAVNSQQSFISHPRCPSRYKL